MKVIEDLKTQYNLKGVGEQQYFLGDIIIHVNKHWDKQGVTMAFSTETYIKNSVESLERQLDKQFGSSSTPMSEADHPELDDSPLMDLEGISKYRSMIGSLNWILTLGRFDIAFALNAMSRYNMAPREGHAKAVTRIFWY